MTSIDLATVGAKADGTTPDTKIIQASIDKVHRTGGGTVQFESGKTYLTGTLYLKSGVHLHLAPGARLVASRDDVAYGSDTGVSPFPGEPLERCLIYGRDCHDIALSGEGCIDGGGDEKSVWGSGPLAIRLENCSRVVLRDLLLTNGRSWFVHLKHCDDVRLTGLKVVNRAQDGFNIDGCTDVRISDCDLKCGDDAICLGTSKTDRPVQNVTVTNCRMTSRWAAMRLGPLSKASIRNVAVSNCVFQDCGGGGIKMDPVEGGEVSDCTFSNIVMDTVAAPIVMVTGRWPEIDATKTERPLMPPGRIRDVRFSQMTIRATGEGPRPDRGGVLFLHGYNGAPITNIVLADMDIRLPGGGTEADASRRDLMDSDAMPWDRYGYWFTDKEAFGVPPAYGIYLRHVAGATFRGLRMRPESPDPRSAMFAMQCRDLDIRDVRVANDEGSAAILTARECDGVDVADAYSRSAKTPMLKEEEGANR